jgi:hypothetical protein
VTITATVIADMPHIETGEAWEKYDENGNIIQPSEAEMAYAAFSVMDGTWYVPQIVWVKEYQGQITDGKIGRPVVRFGPISWLGHKMSNIVKSMIEARK